MRAKPYCSGPCAVLLVLVLALALAGCGTDQPPQSQAPTAEAKPAATSPGNPGTEPPIASALATATVLAGQMPASAPAQGIDMSKVDACKLLSQADIEAVIGAVKYDPHSYTSTEGRQKQCIYVATVVEETDKVEGKSVNLVIWPTSDWEMLKAGRSDAVSGIGDEAYTASLGPTGLALWALLRERAIVNIEVYPKDIEIAKKLALKAIEKLP